MLKFLKINLGVCRAVQDLTRQIVADTNTDVVIINQQYWDYVEKNGWFADNGGRVADYVDSNIVMDEIGLEELGFRWVVIRGTRVYNCYWSQNLSFL